MVDFVARTLLDVQNPVLLHLEVAVDLDRGAHGAALQCLDKADVIPGLEQEGLLDLELREHGLVGRTRDVAALVGLLSRLRTAVLRHRAVLLQPLLRVHGPAPVAPLRRRVAVDQLLFRQFHQRLLHLHFEPRLRDDDGRESPAGATSSLVWNHGGQLRTNVFVRRGNAPVHCLWVVCAAEVEWVNVSSVNGELRGFVEITFRDLCEMFVGDVEQTTFVLHKFVDCHVGLFVYSESERFANRFGFFVALSHLFVIVDKNLFSFFNNIH